MLGCRSRPEMKSSWGGGSREKRLARPPSRRGAVGRGEEAREGRRRNPDTSGRPRAATDAVSTRFPWVTVQVGRPRSSWPVRCTMPAFVRLGAIAPSHSVCRPRDTGCPRESGTILPCLRPSCHSSRHGRVAQDSKKPAGFSSMHRAHHYPGGPSTTACYALGYSPPAPPPGLSTIFRTIGSAVKAVGCGERVSTMPET